VPQSTRVIGSGLSGNVSGARAGAYVLALAGTSPNCDNLDRLSCPTLPWESAPLALGDDCLGMILPSANGEAQFTRFVAEQWLQKAPGGALKIGSEKADAAVLALAEGWSATLVHALAARPLTLTELDRAVEGLDRSAIEPRLEAMRDAGLVEARPRDAEGALYAATDWLRAGIAPLIAAARFEHHFDPMELPKLERLDVEAVFLLTLPLIELPAELSGLCRLVVELPRVEVILPAGAMARVEGGRVVSCIPCLQEEADAFATGPPTAWMDAVINPPASRVIPEGDEALVRALIEGLHDLLFGIPIA
jgi:DNA-binding transcriptional ArsR family regulator